jgi:hypothetical protein
VNPKVVIIVLVVVVILFALAVGVGATRPEGQVSGGGPDWLQGLGARFGVGQALQAEDVSGAIGPCRDALRDKAFVLPAGMSCTLFISESPAAVRKLALEATTGSARVVFDPFGENELTIKQDLEGDRRTMNVPVTKAGGQLAFACLSGSCQFAVR